MKVSTKTLTISYLPEKNELCVISSGNWSDEDLRNVLSPELAERTIEIKVDTYFMEGEDK